jgi:pimeloyl-ACP methyl ester carboxylesterase
MLRRERLTMTQRLTSTTGSVESKDGTAITYDRIGEGPPVILVGGALTSALRSFPSFVQLAEALSACFTVYTYDRRGRGDSGDTQPYAVEREIEDLEALIAEAGGSAHVHGLSSGAVLAVTAVVRGAAITKLTLFEPPLPTGDPDPGAEAERRGLLAAGRRTEVVERYLTRSVALPLDLVDYLRQSPEWPRLEAIAHTLTYDGAITSDRRLWTEEARASHIPVLVLESDASPQHLRTAARRAADALPNTEFRTISGSVHDAPADVLAPVLAAFFAMPTSADGPASAAPTGSERPPG